MVVFLASVFCTVRLQGEACSWFREIGVRFRQPEKDTYHPGIDIGKVCMGRHTPWAAELGRMGPGGALDPLII